MTSRLLLDTHAFFWWAKNAPELSATARSAIADPASEIFVSAATAWEITTKFRLGKMAGAAPIAADVVAAVTRNGFAHLPISIAHAQHAGAMPGKHADPFDRMLAAQALLDGMEMVSNDKAFDAFGVRRLW